MIFRALISFVLSFSLALSPAFAQGPGQQALVNTFIKDTQLGQTKTVAEWLKKNAKSMHPKVAELALQWAVLNPDVKMPKIQANTFKDKKGQEVTRMTFVDKGQSYLIDFVTSGTDVHVLVDGKKLTYNDIYYDGQLEAAVGSPLVTSKEYRSALKAGPQAVQSYQANIKRLVYSLEKLDRTFDKAPKKTSFIDMFLEEANAIPPGSQCIVAGHVSNVSNRLSCGDGDANVIRGCKAGSEIACNPLVYGYDKNVAGKELCVPRRPATEVSVKCDANFPVPGQAKQLAESVAAAHALQGLGTGSEQTDRFYQDLNVEIQNASKVCMNEGFNYDTFAQQVKEGKAPKYAAADFAQKFPEKKDEHHRIACATVMNRLFFAVAGHQCVIDTNAAEANGAKPCPPVTPACQISDKGAAEVFPVPDTGAEVKTEPLPEQPAPAPAPPAKEKKKFPVWAWFVLGGVVLCIAKVLPFCKSDKKKNPPVTPPTLPPMPVGKPGEDGTTRPGQGGVGGVSVIGDPPPATNGGGAVTPRSGTQ